jgi:hypothetical protein
MKPRVYLETSVISYLASWPSRDLIVAANQQLTQEWWQVRRQDFDSFISQLVIQFKKQVQVMKARRNDACRWLRISRC